MPYRTAAATLILSLGIVAQERPVVGEPFREVDVCEGEGCDFGRECAQQAFTVFGTDGDRSDRAFEVSAGDTVTTRRGNMHHDQVGGVLMLRDTVFALESADSARVERGDTVPLLSYVGEGWYHVWLDGARRELSSFWDDRRQTPRPKGRAGRLLFEPLGVRWVEIQDAEGRVGWAPINRDVLVPVDWLGNTCNSTEKQ